MYIVKYFKERVLEHYPDMVNKFQTIEEARIFAKTIISSATEVHSVKIEMDPEWYGPEDPEEVGEE